MREVGNHRGARPISLALLAGLVAFEAVFAMRTGTVGIPGIMLVRLADRSGSAEATPGSPAQDGGESVIAKLPPAVLAAEPPAKKATGSPSPSGEPRLEGLAEIPLDSLSRPKPQPAEPNALAASAGGKEVLPWDAVEPVPFSSDGAASAPPDATASVARPAEVAPAASAPAPVLQLPAGSAVQGWVKAKATEIKGGDRARPLYHFEFWLDAPEDVKRRLVAVAYDFNTPAVRPQSLMSSEEKTGFRVSAGGLACADKVTVTLKFSDGQSQQVAVDGCRLLG